MPTISDIQTQKKRPDRVSIFLDGEFWTGMSQECFLELDLKTGQSLGAEAVSEIESRVVSDSALSYALNRINYSMTSESSLREKLIEREYGESVSEEAIQRCRDMGLLDDESLAREVAEGMRDAGYGPMRVRQKLQHKGVGRDEADRAILGSFETAGELSLAKASLRMKYGESPLDRPQQRKAFGYLTRRGFGAHVSQLAIENRALSEDEEEHRHDAHEALDLLSKQYGESAFRPENRSKSMSFLTRRGFTRNVVERATRAGAELY